VIYGAISAYRVMEKQSSGQIVNISSLAGLIPIPKEIPYCTSKWAVAGFTSSLRVEGADLGIKVNLVCPGIMHTPIHDKTPWVNVDKEKLIQPKVMKYFMTPDKAAGKILRGMRQNKSVLIFPLYAHMVWWLYRFNPAIFQFVFKTIIRDFRKQRIVR
jgi:short-subunit dehydrogenase